MEYHYNPTGRRNLGWPKGRWNSQLDSEKDLDLFLATAGEEKSKETFRGSNLLGLGSTYFSRYKCFGGA